MTQQLRQGFLAITMAMVVAVSCTAGSGGSPTATTTAVPPTPTPQATGWTTVEECVAVMSAPPYNLPRHGVLGSGATRACQMEIRSWRAGMPVRHQRVLDIVELEKRLQPITDDLRNFKRCITGSRTTDELRFCGDR